MKEKKFDFDIIVIGSGSAGLSAAIFASKQNARVALAEQSIFGGKTLNVLDSPLASALSFTRAHLDSRLASRFGVSSGEVRYNFPKLRSWLYKSRKASGAGDISVLEDNNISYLRGIAHFLSPYELSVDSDVYSAPRFIVASGSVLNTKTIIGLDTIDYLTPEKALLLSRPPESLAIVGGGATGCALAEYFSTLGTKVTLFELAPRLLPREDDEAGASISSVLSSCYKVKVLTETRVVSACIESGKKSLSFLRGAERKSASFSDVLIATGFSPALDLGLDNAGIKYDQNGIIVDNYLTTSMKHITSAGSCTGASFSSEFSAYSGALAATNLLCKSRSVVKPLGFPRIAYTVPYVASVGESEESLRKSGKKYKKSLLPLKSTPYSSVSGDSVGFIKLLVDQNLHLLGATVMSASAPELISELSLILRSRISMLEVATSPVVSTSSSELIRLAARPLANNSK